MPTVEEQVGEPQPSDKEYIDIIRSDTEVDKKFIKDTGLPAKIVYYCRDCKKVTKPKRIGKKFKFNCTECNGSNVAFGSEESIQHYYKITPSELEAKK